MEFKRSKYSKRIRKKKKLGEFRVYGFLVDVYCDENPELEVIGEIIEILESRGLYCGGGGDKHKYSLYVDGLKRQEDKDFVVEELKKSKNITKVIPYETVDTWHDDAAEYYQKIESIREENG